VEIRAITELRRAFATAAAVTPCLNSPDLLVRRELEAPYPTQVQCVHVTRRLAFAPQQQDIRAENQPPKAVNWRENSP
jgi:hypothetical protein